MPNYIYTCEKCGKHVELFANINDEKTPPTCCGASTYHDYQAERFRGIAHREKGTEYATGFVETFENNGHHEQVFIKSRAHHMQELEKRKLIQKGPQNPEAVYRRKHARDRIPEQRRAVAEERGAREG